MYSGLKAQACFASNRYHGRPEQNRFCGQPKLVSRPKNSSCYRDPIPFPHKLFRGARVLHSQNCKLVNIIIIIFVSFFFKYFASTYLNFHPLQKETLKLSSIVFKVPKYSWPLVLKIEFIFILEIFHPSKISTKSYRFSYGKLKLKIFHVVIWPITTCHYGCSFDLSNDIEFSCMMCWVGTL